MLCTTGVLHLVLFVLPLCTELGLRFFFIFVLFLVLMVTEEKTGICDYKNVVSIENSDNKPLLFSVLGIFLLQMAKHSVFNYSEAEASWKFQIGHKSSPLVSFLSFPFPFLPLTPVLCLL